MKKVAVFFVFVVFMAIGFSALYSAQTQRVRTFGGREIIFSPSGKELPFYFSDVPGIMQTDDPIKQRIEYIKYLNATTLCVQSMNALSFINDSNSIRVKVNDMDSTSSITDPSAKFEIVFDHFVRQGPDKIIVTTLCGQEIINDHQFEVVKNDFIEQMKIVSSMGFDYYGSLPDYVIKSHADRLGISEKDYLGELGNKIQGFGDVTVRDLNRVPPTFRKSDFVIRELHFGYNPAIFGVLGVAWLDTGIVYYNPQARIRDYLTGEPGVLLHETTHNNSKLQNWPFSSIDTELMASIPEMLTPKNQIDFFSHGYAQKLRDLTFTYFGYNFSQAQDEIFLFDYGGNILIDENKYRENFKKLEIIKKELLSASKDVIFEYFTDELWWSALNRRWGESTTMFDVTMALKYEPTILGGREQTQKWLATHDEEIKEGIKRAWDKTKQGSGNNGFSDQHVPQFIVEQYKRLFTEKEQEAIKEYFKKNPKAVEIISKMNVEDLLKFFSGFKSKNIGGVR